MSSRFGSILFWCPRFVLHVRVYTVAVMRLHRIAVALLGVLSGLLVLSGLSQTSAPPSRATEHGISEAGKAALSRQLGDAVGRGDTPGVVALVVGREGVLYEASAGKLDTDNTAMPVNAIFSIASMTKPV